MSDDHNVVPDAQRTAMRLLEQEAERTRGLLMGAAWTNKSFSNNHRFAAQVDIADCTSDSTELAKRVEELLTAELGEAANIKVVLVDERTGLGGWQRSGFVTNISMSAEPTF